MPHYAPPVRGYPPPGYAPYGSPRGPGGLPTDQASLDVRAFIPAQYEHVQIHPAGVIAALALGIVVVMLVQRQRAK